MAKAKTSELMRLMVAVRRAGGTEAVASSINLSLNMMRRVLNGRRQLQADEAVRMATFCRVDLEWLLTGKKSPTSAAPPNDDVQEDDEQVSASIRDVGKLEREWASAGELAALRLPTMPATRNGIAFHIKRGTWLRPEWEKSKWRVRTKSGGGYEFHFSLLPRAARSRWIERFGALKESPPPAIGGHLTLQDDNAIEAELTETKLALQRANNALRVVCETVIKETSSRAKLRTTTAELLLAILAGNNPLC